MTYSTRLLALFTLFLSLQSQAQETLYTDTIFFMNGHILECDIVDSSDIEVVFNYKKRKKTKTIGVHKSEVFGVVENGEKRIYYAENAIAGDDLSEAEVMVYLAGQRDAREKYSTKLVFYTGTALSLASSILGEAGFLATTVPIVVYPAAQFIPVIKIKENTITNPHHKFNVIYSEGYEGVARGKRMVAAIKGSALGSVVGAFIYRIALR